MIKRQGHYLSIYLSDLSFEWLQNKYLQPRPVFFKNSESVPLKEPGSLSGTPEPLKKKGKTRLRMRDPFVISPVSRHFIRQQLTTLNPKKAVGLDGISSRFLRDGATAIVEPVSHMINLSITTETVPTAFKVAKVVPLFKKGSKVDAGNYRPVSILNVMSKILERAVHGQVRDYLERRGILFSHQSGFRGKYSTDTCLIDLSDFIRGEMSNGNLVGMVCIDLQKAFDTVEHTILLSKLSAIGFSDSAVNWFRSYLESRVQCTEVDGQRSSFLEISCGVPQGSILGPQLFLIYVNDMYSCLTCRLSLYADDSALFFAHKDPAVIATRLGIELANCKRWLTDNRLSLHMGKTECLLFGTSRKLKKVGSFDISCEGLPIKRVSMIKYLGMELDETLSGEAHGKKLIGKCVGRISFLYRYSTLLDQKTRAILCSALIQPYLDYCCSSWYSSLSVKLKLQIDVIQRRMVRFVFSYGPRFHVDLTHLKQLSWMSISDRVGYFKRMHVFKMRQGLAPSYLTERFTRIEHAHSYGTRGSGRNFSVSEEICGSLVSFSYTAVKLWNQLPNEIKEAGTMAIFKRKLREFIFRTY